MDCLCENFSLEELDKEIMLECIEKTSKDEMANLILVSYINHPRIMDGDMVYFVMGLIE